MADRKYFVLCEQNCKFEGMTKEQILTAISQAVATGSVGNCDTGFVQTIKTINGQPLRFFVGTQAEYESLSASDKENLFAIITNDTSLEGIEEAIRSLQSNVTSLHGRCNSIATDVRSGTIVAGKAKVLNPTFKAFTYSNKAYDTDGNYLGTGGTYLELTQGKTYLFINTTLGLTFLLTVREKSSDGTNVRSYSSVCSNVSIEYMLDYSSNKLLTAREKTIGADAWGQVLEGDEMHDTQFIYTEIC